MLQSLYSMITTLYLCICFSMTLFCSNGKSNVSLKSLNAMAKTAKKTAKKAAKKTAKKAAKKKK